MTTARILLVVAALSSGLLMTLIAFFHRGLRDLTAPRFALVVQRFLGVARTHPLHYGLVIVSLLAPVAALVLLRGSAGDPAFILTLLGLAALDRKSMNSSHANISYAVFCLKTKILMKWMRET